MRDTVIERIPPEQAVGILKKEGIIVTEEQATAITAFLYLIAEIIIDQYLEGKT